MDDLLDEVVRLRGVGGCLLISGEGLAIASRLREGQDEEQLSASASELVAHCQTLCERSELGPASIIQAQTASGGLAMVAAGDSFLVVIIDPNANLALLQLELGPFADAFAKRLAL